MKRTIAFMLVLFILLSMASAFAQGLRISHISSQGDCTVALQKDGTVKTIGTNDYGQCDTANWHGVVSISAGLFHTLGLKSDGTVYATGRNTSGECDVDNWNDIIMVATGWQSSFGLKKDGTIVYTGLTDASETKEIGEWNNIVWIGSKYENGLFAIDKYGKAYGTGMDFSLAHNVVQICGIFGRTLFLFADGTMKWLCGGDSEGSEWIDIDYPGSKNVCEVTLLSTCYVALKKDGTVISELEGADFSDWTDVVEIEGDIGVKSDGSTIVLDMYIFDEWVFDYPPDQLHEIGTWKVMVDRDTLPVPDKQSPTT